MVNLERTCVLLFCYFLYFKVNLHLEKTNQLGKSSPNFIFAVVNLDPIILEMRWIDGESWPNNFDEKVNRGEDLRLVGSRCPLTRALSNKLDWKFRNLLIRLIVTIYYLTATKKASAKEDVLRELDVMKMLKPHPNVVHLLGYCVERGLYWYVQPFSNIYLHETSHSVIEFKWLHPK